MLQLRTVQSAAAVVCPRKMNVLQYVHSALSSLLKEGAAGQAAFLPRVLVAHPLPSLLVAPQHVLLP